MQSRPKKQPYQKERKISFFKQLSLTVVFLYVKLVLYGKGEENRELAFEQVYQEALENADLIMETDGKFSKSFLAKMDKVKIKHRFDNLPDYVLSFRVFSMSIDTEKEDETDVTIIFEIFGKSYVITYLKNQENGIYNARVFPVVPF